MDLPKLNKVQCELADIEFASSGLLLSERIVVGYKNIEIIPSHCYLKYHTYLHRIALPPAISLESNPITTMVLNLDFASIDG